MRRYSLLLGCLFMLCSCRERMDLAPVVESHGGSMYSGASQHIVHRYDTLYAIAFRYDQDYQTLALINHLRPPYTLYVGQTIRLKSNGPSFNPVVPHEIKRAARAPQRMRSLPKAATPVAVKINHRWVWPTRARRIISYFSPAAGRKGIDIAGHSGDKIYAANSGIIAYAGDGLTGYGNLIIIKHDNQLLTAYGHNAHNLVREGQHVRVGQVIADMGMLDRRYWGVHFEIRQLGKPINPLKYL
jgi:lipoprotein NlpD